MDTYKAGDNIDVVRWNSILQCKDVAVFKEIDSMAAAMNIHSVSGGCDSLQQSINEFTEWYHKPVDPFLLQQTLPLKIQEHLPPSLFMFKQKKQTTWGYDEQALVLSRREADGVIFFQYKSGLSWLEDGENAYPEYTWTLFDQKIQMLWAKLGAFLSCEEYRACVLHPEESMQAMYHTGDLRGVLNTSEMSKYTAGYWLVHSLGADLSELPVCDKYLSYMKSMDSLQSTERVRHLDVPIHLVFWRLDIPQRKMSLLNNSANWMLPYMREKSLLNENIPKNKNTLAGMHMCMKQPNSDDIRQSIKDYFKNHHERVPEHFLESVHFFVHSPLDMSKVTHTALGERVTWKHEHADIDPRYTEIQDAESGKYMRYRDWVALYSDDRFTLQSRLAAHSLEVKTFYNRSLPCIETAKTADKTTKWVYVMSNQPIAFRVLHGDPSDLAKLLQMNFSFDKKNKNQEMYSLSNNKMGLVELCGSKEKELKMTILHCEQ
jgi:hypothetical protein